MIEFPIQTGEYEHYKGNRYRVIGIARHSETPEELVVYRALYPHTINLCKKTQNANRKIVDANHGVGVYGEGGLWVRPAKMFLEAVDAGGKSMPRFRRVGD